MNESGIRPLEFKVLVKPTKVEEKTKGGIFLPEEALTKEEVSVTEGILIEIPPLAFTNPDWLEPPKVGDLVIFQKFAGQQLDGKDGEKYRLMDDRDIAGVRYE